MGLFRLQKYKKFESNSQPGIILLALTGCCFGCKSTKNLRAIHNSAVQQDFLFDVVSAAKVQKIWEQFTTPWLRFRLFYRCFGCKSTKNLRAIHNQRQPHNIFFLVVSAAKVQKIWEQFTTEMIVHAPFKELFRLQKYKKFESNSQLKPQCHVLRTSCFGCKSTKNLRAIHNTQTIGRSFRRLFRLQKYKKFESNSQHSLKLRERKISCFGCKSTKNLRAIHNTWNNLMCVCALFRLQKYKKFESNSQPRW